jgi:hypothetical protein
MERPRKRPKSDLLGCICLDGDYKGDCRRNCRRDGEEWEEPVGCDVELLRIRLRSANDDDPSNIAYERVLLIEDTHNVVGLAAQSNGRMRIWVN